MSGGNDANSKLKELLESWKVVILNDRLQEYGYDIHSLENITGEALTNIFEEKSFYGPLQRFRALHCQWVKTAVATTPESIAPQSDDESGSSENSRVLKKTEAGVKLVAYYDKKMSFLHGDRLELVHLIADHLVSIKYKMNIKDFKEISNQIAMVFPHEDREDYCKKKNGRNTGLLVIAYYNRLAAENKKAEKSKNKEKRRQTSSDPEITTDSMNDEVKKAIEWMEMHNPVDEGDQDVQEFLLEKWNFCFQYRTETIKKAKNNDEILNSWPALKSYYGFHLLELDFKTIFGDCSDNFIEGWALFADENLKVLRKLIADPDVIESLRTLSEATAATNFHNIRMVLALQHLRVNSPIHRPIKIQAIPELYELYLD